MARIAVVAYPIFDGVVLEWIESIRARHDPQAGRIAPHFTLVFPVDAPSADVTEEIQRVAVQHAPVPFVLRSAIAQADRVRPDGGGHVFLVPEGGRDRIVRLHDQLYAGVLRPHLREDLEFIPHITIAAHTDLGWCETFAQEITRTLQPVSGLIETITLIDIGGTSIDALASAAMGTDEGWTQR